MVICFYHWFLETCQFIKDYHIAGENDQLHIYDTKEQCSAEVKRLFPNATGVEWDEDYNHCHAGYGNRLDPYVGFGYWSCLFEGKEISVELFIMKS